MKIALAQMNPATGDFDANLKEALSLAQKAADGGASLVVYPPFALSGYVEDTLASYGPFERAFDDALDTFAHSAALPALIGGPLANHAMDFDVKTACNPAGCISPATSTVYFCDGADGLPLICDSPSLSAGCFDLEGRKVVCAFDSADAEADAAARGADLSIRFSLSRFHEALASPSFLARHVAPPEEALTSSPDTPLVDIRLVGGQDCEVFTGGSDAFGPSGKPLVLLSLFEPDFRIIDTDAPAEALELQDECDEAALLCSALVCSIRDYWHKSGLSDCVLGLSGGIDSSVVASLSVRALGPDHVHGLLMPSRVSSEGSVSDALALARNLGIDTRTIPIGDAVDHLCDLLAEPCGGAVNGLALENLQSRMRTVYLMTLANQMGWALINTGNKSEAAMGFSTLYGDTAGAFAPLGDCYKHQVYALARHMNEREEIIPTSVLEKAPSAELYEGARDDDRLPPYEVLDAILVRHLDEGQGLRDLVAAGFDEETVASVLSAVSKSEFKRRQEPLGPQVSLCSFNARNWPVTNRFIDKGAPNR